MNLKTIGLIASTLIASQLFANVQEIHTLNRADATINIARVQNSFTLKKPDRSNNTRINLVVKDLGGATDVSPTMELYLVYWKDGEMQNATAAFDLGSTYSLVDYNDDGQGHITMKLKEYGDRGFQIDTVKVDYTEFSTKFERDAASVEEEFGTEWVNGSIYSKVVQ